MSQRLLVINPYSPYFHYIPMGTFGLCDFLTQHKIESRIYNQALYPHTQGNSKLKKIIEKFQPTHLAILFHWQETAHGVDEIIRFFNDNSVNLPLIIGGITASFFGNQILHHYPRVDYLISGDAELPLLNLLNGKPHQEIANLIYRKDAQIIPPQHTWLAEQPFLDELSFAQYGLLFDHELYFKKINDILGYPLFLGRGCVFDCGYCGGSRTAFKQHTLRHSPTNRSIKAVLYDLHALKNVTDTLYICYENSQKYILQLFRSITEDPELRGYFTLNYGAWHLLGDDFLDLYCLAFDTTKKKPIFEFSPEVISDASRQKIKNYAAYSLQQLLKNCKAIEQRFQQAVKLELFFSRYHPTEATTELLLEEIKSIFSLKHSLFMEQSSSIHICYDHLSTDVASRYWKEYADLPFCEFLAQKELIDSHKRYPFPVDNLCFYIPETLLQKDQVQLEALILVLEQLELECHELFHALFFCFGPAWIDTISTIIFPLATAQPDIFFANIDLDELLNRFAPLLVNEAPYNRYSFWPDLIKYSLAKQKGLSHSSKKSVQINLKDTPYVLNKQKVGVHQHEYPSISHFLQRLTVEAPEEFSYQRTIVLYLHDEVLTLPHRSFRSTLQEFEQPKTIETYLEELQRTVAIDAAKHLETLQLLIENEVLQPAARKERDKS